LEDTMARSVTGGTIWMPVLHHGTSRVFAIAMAGTAAAGTIDVTRGEGEFGRGFYSQSSSGNAARRGQSIYGNHHAVLVLTIDNQACHALRFKRLKLNMAQRLNAKLAGNARKIYTTVHDVMVGPLVDEPRIEQQKFQTAKAQTLLNGPLTQRTVR
jgi:hypothetical protein